MELTVKDAERILGEVPHDKCFVCGDGCLNTSLVDLQQCLSHISEETYSGHVTSSKNDYSNWIRDVLGDWELAETLQKAKNRKDAVKILKQRVNFLQKLRSSAKSREEASSVPLDMLK